MLVILGSSCVDSRLKPSSSRKLIKESHYVYDTDELLKEINYCYDNDGKLLKETSIFVHAVLRTSRNPKIWKTRPS